MLLNEKQKKYLRQRGHSLEPVLQTGGAGLSPGLLAELSSALDHHELLKIRVRAPDRDRRDALVRTLCEAAGAELVQRIGHVALLWRPNPECRRIVLPDQAPSTGPAVVRGSEPRSPRKRDRRRAPAR